MLDLVISTGSQDTPYIVVMFSDQDTHISGYALEHFSRSAERSICFFSLLMPFVFVKMEKIPNGRFWSVVLNRFLTAPLRLENMFIGQGTGLLLSRECLSHDKTYFRMSARTFESMM